MLSSLNDGCYRVAEEKERGNGLFIRVIERRPVRLRGSQRRLLRSAVLFSSSSSSSFFFLSVSGSVFFVFSLLASLACSLFDLIFFCWPSLLFAVMLFGCRVAIYGGVGSDRRLSVGSFFCFLPLFFTAPPISDDVFIVAARQKWRNYFDANALVDVNDWPADALAQRRSP